MLHVLNGDSTRMSLERSSVRGTIVVYPDVLHDIREMDKVLQQQDSPPEWRLEEELLKPVDTSPMAEDGSNFKSINANNIRDILFLGSQEAKEKNHSLIVMLKIQDEKSLNESSKKAIVYVKEHSNYGQSKLSELEKQLILVTEKANIDN